LQVVGDVLLEALAEIEARSQKVEGLRP
jgi:hypothetical protein